MFSIPPRAEQKEEEEELDLNTPPARRGSARNTAAWRARLAVRPRLHVAASRSVKNGTML
jgi:hypothetical protein